jgi:hypothetical protein
MVKYYKIKVTQNSLKLYYKKAQGLPDLITKYTIPWCQTVFSNVPLPLLSSKAGLQSTLILETTFVHLPTIPNGRPPGMRRQV